MKIFTDKKSESKSHSVVSNSCDPLDYTVHGILQAITAVGSLSLLQGIFPTQGLNPGLPHCRQILYQLSNKGSPRILDWVAAAAAAKSLQSCPTLCDPMNCGPPGISVHGNSPGKNTGVGCHALLQGIFLTQGSKPGLPHCRQILYHLSHERSPNKLSSIKTNLNRNRKKWCEIRRKTIFQSQISLSLSRSLSLSLFFF